MLRQSKEIQLNNRSCAKCLSTRNTEKKFGGGGGVISNIWVKKKKRHVFIQIGYMIERCFKTSKLSHYQADLENLVH